MKKFQVSILFFIFLFQNINSQNYIKIGDSLMTEEKFIVDFEIVKKEYIPKHTNYTVFEKVRNNDSIIKNIQIIVTNQVEKPTYSYYSFLNKPFPNFTFKDLKNVEYSNTSFYNKPTIVCIWDSKYLPDKRVVKKLNSINSERKFNVVAFLTEGKPNKAKINKIDFPVFQNTTTWLIENFEDYYTPQYFIINADGILTFIFTRYPNRETKYKPINKTHIEIFERLLL